MDNKCENNHLVYMHTNMLNGKVYIGITSKSANSRWGKNGSGYSNNKHFSNAISKYGWDSFKHEIIADELSKEEACKLEKKLIAKYQSQDSRYGYNKAEGGETNIGWIMSEEDRLKKSKPVCQYDTKGNLLKRWEASISACNELGFKSNEKLLATCRGERKTYKGYVWRFSNDPFDKYDSHNYRLEMTSKEVDMYSIDGEYIKTFCSVAEASRETGISSASSISLVCEGILQKMKGFVFRWKGEAFDKYYIGRLSNDKRRVNQYTLEGVFVATFDSCAEAEKKTGIPNNNIVKVCKHSSRKQAGGFVWRYADDTQCFDEANLELNHISNSYDEAWNVFYELAKAYYEENGKLDIKRNYEIDGQKLGIWISNQRKKYIKGKLKQDRIDKLNEIDMLWIAKK